MASRNRGKTSAYPAVAMGVDGLGLAQLPVPEDRKPTGVEGRALLRRYLLSRDYQPDRERNPQTGVFTSLAIGRDGFPLVSYLFQTTGGDLKVARCSDLACSAATFQVVDGPESVGFYSSVAIGRDDLPIISYFDETNFDLKVAHCLDRFCGASATPARVPYLDTLQDGGHEELGWSPRRARPHRNG